MLKIKEYLTNWISKINPDFKYLDYLLIGTEILIIALVAFIIDYFSQKILLRVISKVVSKSKTSWDDMLFNRKVFNKLVHIFPAIVVQYMIKYYLADYVTLVKLLNNVVSIYIIIVSIRAIVSLINGLHDIYLTLPISKDRPIKSYLQIVIIMVYFVGIIWMLSIAMDKKVVYFFTGLGAIAAVLMLVFKDSILGLVGGIQLSANDMVRPGDWIEMPSRKADGDVIDISLHTVKVQNWDKTITTIPTYALVNESFINWRGMQQSGGRRIKRSINIDMTSVKFCTPEMIERFKKIKVLKHYVETKQEELRIHNEKNEIDETVKVNGRRMTNLGTFRKYIENYLRNHPKINQDMTFLVRQLHPWEKGIPIEIYVFSNDIVWANYEAIQADIFDHILAVVPEFELSVFQNPTGSDFKQLMRKAAK